eukprot:gene12405-6072_t
MVQVELFSGEEKFTFNKWFWSGSALGAFAHVLACNVQHINPIRKPWQLLSVVFFSGVTFRVVESVNDGMAKELHRKRGQFLKMREKRYLGNKRMDELYESIQKEEEKEE